MLKIVAAYVVLVVLVAAIHTADQPECKAADEATAQAAADRLGGRFAKLDGDEAVRFIKAFNAIGDPTDYKGSKVIIVVMPDREHVMIGISGEVCNPVMVISAETFLKAYTAARGERS